MRQSEHLALLKLADAKQKEEHKKQSDNLQKMLQVWVTEVQLVEAA